MFVWLLDTGCYMVLSFVVMPHNYFEKAEVAYCRYRLGHRTTVLHGVAACCSCIFHRIFPIC